MIVAAGQQREELSASGNPEGRHRERPLPDRRQGERELARRGLITANTASHRDEGRTGDDRAQPGTYPASLSQFVMCGWT